MRPGARRATIVLARRQRSSSAATAELLWALQGAGGARFGVVTELTLRTVPAPRRDRAPPRTAHDARAGARDLEAASTPPDALAASLLIIGGTAHVFGAHIGPAAEAAELLAPFGGTPAPRELPYRDVKRRLAETGPGDGEDLPFHRSGFFAEPIAITDRPGHRVRLLAARRRLQPRRARRHRVPPSHAPRFLLKVAGKDQHAVDGALPAAATGVYVNFPEPDRDLWDAAYLGTNRERLLALRAAMTRSAPFAAIRAAKT